MFSTKSLFAIDTVKISDFSSNSDPEWIKLINNTDENISIENWVFRDENDNSNNKDSVSLTGCISPHSYQTFYHDKGWLNNDGDTIYLYDLNKSLIDSLVYSVGKSDVNSQFDNTCVLPTPTPTPTATPTPTPTAAPSPTPTLTPTQTPTPTITPTKIPTVTPTPTDEPIPTAAIEPIDTTNTPTEEILTPTITQIPAQELILGETTTSKKNPLPLIFICIGALFLLTPLIIAKIKHEN